MRYGRKNLIFGFVYLVFTLALGVVISFKLKGDPEFAKAGFAFPRVIMRAAHAHGNLESVLNIIVGLIVDRLRVEGNLKQTISVLIIAGALLHSGMLYIMPAIPWASNLTVFGAVAIIAAVILTAYALVRGIE